MSDRLIKISLRRCHAQTVKNGASSHKTNYFYIFSENPNLEGHQNRCIGSKVTALLLKGCILPTGGASSGRFCACSLRSRIVSVVTSLSASCSKHHFTRPALPVPTSACLISLKAPLFPCSPVVRLIGLKSAVFLSCFLVSSEYYCNIKWWLEKQCTLQRLYLANQWIQH